MKTSVKRAKWYMQYNKECPICGIWQGFKEARYTKPPKKANRYLALQGEVCGYHFV